MAPGLKKSEDLKDCCNYRPMCNSQNKQRLFPKQRQETDLSNGDIMYSVYDRKKERFVLQMITNFLFLTIPMSCMTYQHFT